MKDESFNPTSGVFPLHPGDNAGKVLTDKWLVDCLNSLQRRGKAIYMTATDPDPHGSMLITNRFLRYPSDKSPTPSSST